MAYGLSNGHVTDDITWPPKMLWGNTVGYPSDSLASCFYFSNIQCNGKRYHAIMHYINWYWHCPYLTNVIVNFSVKSTGTNGGFNAWWLNAICPLPQAT